MRTFNRRGGYSEHIDRSVRSGLEGRIIDQATKAGYSVTYEGYQLKYAIPESNHTYTPDLVLPNGIIVEMKGLFEADDRKKMLLVKTQYSHLDIRMVFQNANTKIYKGSPTSYGDWCRKNGFPFASKLIPDEWFKEPPKSTQGLIPKKGK